MADIKKYYLQPTKLIPNSPYPLLHYRGLLSTNSQSLATQFYDLLTTNGWRAQWIFRYGKTQKSHYHSLAHECMVVLTGQATIRFGVADTSEDMDENTWGSAKEDGGVELEVQAGDVLIIPAGVAHKTYNPRPDAGFKLLTPGNGHGLPSSFRDEIKNIHLSGFTMMGSYPIEGGPWDFAVGGEGALTYSHVWSIPPPKLDPMLGKSEVGICTSWKQQVAGWPRNMANVKL